LDVTVDSGRYPVQNEQFSINVSAKDSARALHNDRGIVYKNNKATFIKQLDSYFDD